MASRGNRNLSSLDNFMLDYYVVRYTEISNRINELYRDLDSIHENIERIHDNHRDDPHYSYNTTANINNQRRTRTHVHPTHTSQNIQRVPNPATLVNDVRNVFSNFFTNVPVVPSAEQITTATRIVQYGTINNPLNEACPISLERFRNEDLITQINHCGHLFNIEELAEWFQNNVRCPVCRYDIRNYLSSTEEQSQPQPQPQPQPITINPAILNNIPQQLLNILNSPNGRSTIDASNNIIFIYETTHG